MECFLNRVEVRMDISNRSGNVVFDTSIWATITKFIFDEALKTILSRFQRYELLLSLLVQFA